MHRYGKHLLGSLFAASLLSFSPLSLAQESEIDVLKEIRDTLADIGALANNTIEEAMAMVAEMAYPSTPTVAETMLANLNYKQQAAPTQLFEANTRLSKTMGLYLSPNKLTIDDNTRAYELLPTVEADVSAKVASFSVGSILNSSGMTTNSKMASYAQNFINLTIDIDNTPKNLDFVVMNSLDNPKRNYLTALGSFISVQSVGIAAFYDSFAKRIIIPGLGTKTGMIRLYPLDENDTGTIGSPIADASPLQVDEYLANRRVMNPKWYADMEAAAPSTVQRETLYVIAELRQEMFKQRQALEKLNATMAAFQLQEAQRENRAKFLVQPPSSVSTE